MSVKFTKELEEAIRKRISEKLVIIEGEDGPEIRGADDLISSLEDYMSPVSPLNDVFKFSIKSIRENIEMAKKMNEYLGFIDPDDHEWVFHKK